MTWIVQTALTNALLVVPLAIAVAILSRWLRRPALSAALWTLVLLKFITPAVYHVELPVRLPAAPQAAPPLAQLNISAGPLNASEASRPLPPVIAEWTELTITRPTPGRAVDGAVVAPSPPISAAPLVAADASQQGAPPIEVPWWAILWGAAALWLAGTCLFLAVTLIRSAQFQRLLHRAERAPGDITDRTAALAAQIGLRVAPEVRLTPGRVPPLMWVSGRRSTLLLPTKLWAELDAHQQSALLIHELAHVRRHDHWNRRLELVARSLYWWHPVVWWAGSRLREAEEQCCDAWVVDLLPRAAPAYAEALLKTIDYLSSAVTPVPVLATGLHPRRHRVRALQRRLTMILEHRTSPRLSAWARLATLTAAAVILPVSLLSLADDDGITPAVQQPARSADAAPAEAVAERASTPPSYNGASEGDYSASDDAHPRSDSAHDPTWPAGAVAQGAKAPASADEDTSKETASLLKVFALTNLSAESAMRQLTGLFPERTDLGMTADPRTNRLIVRADAGTLTIIEALLIHLDAAHPAKEVDEAVPQEAPADVRLRALESQIEALESTLRALREQQTVRGRVESSRQLPQPAVEPTDPVQAESAVLPANEEPSAAATDDPASGNLPAETTGAPPLPETITVVRAHYVMGPQLTESLRELLQLIPGENDVLMAWVGTQSDPYGAQGYGGTDYGGGYSAPPSYPGEMTGMMMGEYGVGQPTGLTVIATPELQEVVRDFIVALTYDWQAPDADDAGRQTFQLTRQRYRLLSSFHKPLKEVLSVIQREGSTRPLAIYSTGDAVIITTLEALQAPLARLLNFINERHPVNSRFSLFGPPDTPATGMGRSLDVIPRYDPPGSTGGSTGQPVHPSSFTAPDGTFGTATWPTRQAPEASKRPPSAFDERPSLSPAARRELDLLQAEHDVLSLREELTFAKRLLEKGLKSKQEVTALERRVLHAARRLELLQAEQENFKADKSRTDTDEPDDDAEEEPDAESSEGSTSSLEPALNPLPTY